MKALREKRVSLRSLFRRSLVILSLLALAFAVSIAGCSSDSGDSGDTGNTGNTGDTGGTGGTVAAPPTVVGLQVIKHPYMPSFEGAEPDLSGITVAVTWSDNTTVLESDTSKFMVSPPIAFVATAGTNAGFNREDYKVRYVGENAWFDYDSAYQVPVYIPAVIALDVTSGFQASTTEYPYIDGKISEVYEDQGVDPTGVKFVGIYSEFKFNETPTDGSDYITLLGENDIRNGQDALSKANNNARDAGYQDAAEMFVKKDYKFGLTLSEIDALNDEEHIRWPILPIPANGTWTRYNIKSNKVSASGEAWEIGDRGQATKYRIFYWTDKLMGTKTNSPIADSGCDDIEVPHDYYYKVARLDYKSGADRIKVFGADNGDYMALNGTFANKDMTDTLSNNVYPRTTPPTTTFPKYTTAGNYTYSADKIEVVKRNWIKALFDAQVEFTVRYYIPEDSPAIVKSRDIKMADYIKAMNKTVGGVPKATLPFFAGNADAPLDSSVVDSVLEEYDLALKLYYYNPKIKDLLNLDDTIDATPDAATINVSKSIARYSSLVLTRNDISDHSEPQVDSRPTVSGSVTVEDKMLVNLYNALQQYWRPEYVYEGDVKNVKIDWPQPSGADDADDHARALFIRQIITDYDLDPVEGGTPELREGAITLTGPASAEWDEGEVTFQYYVLP